MAQAACIMRIVLRAQTMKGIITRRRAKPEERERFQNPLLHDQKEQTTVWLGRAENSLVRLSERPVEYSGKKRMKPGCPKTAHSL